MAKHERKEPTQAQQQVYDNFLKSLFEGREKDILPYFLPDVEYLETLDIEAHRTTLRTDRVYKVMLEEHLHIVDVEFETGSHPHMEARLLDYHAYLYRKYRLPVISIIVYPFRTKMAISPLREVSGKQELLLFHFRMLPLWQLKAERYLNEHAVLMYSLLPSMEGANTRLLSKAIDEMIEYYQDDQTTLAQELRWMGIVLRRADTVPIADKRQIEERLNMYDDLFEKDPKMRRIRAESKAEGRAEGEAAGEARGEAKGEARGEAKGKAEGLQLALVTVIEERFPPLAELVQGKITRIDRPDALRLLLKGIAAAPDEASARLLLELLVA
ncbi:MAG TPA: hypothetical protein VGN15_01655 [Ktedonobacteraceae bacterium]|nr:hypothetical protein [Ktedonobacteraceae bacterium]